MYAGGSNKDEWVFSGSGNYISSYSPVLSFGNQMFIIFTTDGNGVGKGFTAKIAFGSKTFR